jgi:hypothetical protein
MEPLDKLASTIDLIEGRVRQLERAETVNVIIKTTTGNPAAGLTGNLLINTFDNKAFIWADTGWREIGTW